ncbi:MAG TPA: DUF3866 family protein, partial [Actinomycetota bacterium]|nr:DUF3866 family protein [Actinomycetota bacterium]
ERHRGLSHHTATALSLALARAQVTVPELSPERRSEIKASLDDIAVLHQVIEVDLGPAEAALKDARVSLRSMGRTYDDDPDFFRAAAAAGVHAAGIARARK